MSIVPSEKRFECCLIKDLSIITDLLNGLLSSPVAMKVLPASEIPEGLSGIGALLLLGCIAHSD